MVKQKVDQDQGYRESSGEEMYVAILNKVVRMGFITTMTFKERLAGSKGDSHADSRGKSIPGPGNHVFRGIELGVGVDVQGTARKPVWLENSE